MRQCCVHHCRVRSSGVSKAKNTKFFLFPKEETLKKAWLQAINRKEEELNMKYAKVCQHHFSPDCMEERWTKPQKKNVEPRIIVRLKAGSIPTLLLDVQSPPRNQRNTVKSQIQ
ncbi:THAP domain-containing protein 1-like [Solenopsis invicta]|uniref:THAP domain-containing protein 1-like n=1 Tax=Solenopsis invicta TaxID=13686 RepID=UPI0005960B1E|nr:THAP domain-containing protein 1-like [Solenopsis invicta]XP_039306570.1 THAP domain-containing protein 1-like [Solenopsis invicta]